MKIAIIPGSFDPMTLGHLDLVKRALKIFDKVVVAVMVNDQKEYMFSVEERIEIARLSCRDLENVEVIYDDGMLFELADRVGACAIVKGVRNAKDYKYEAEMANYNHYKNSKVETMLLQSTENFMSVSSTELRKRIIHNIDISGIVSVNAVRYIHDIIVKNKLCKK